MKKSILKDSIVYGLTNALVKFSSLLTLPVYTRVLSSEAFGTLDLYITLTAIIFILFETQMASGFMREYYTFRQKEKLDRLTGNVIYYYFLSFLLAIFIAMILIKNFPQSPYLNIHYLLPVIFYLLPRQIFDLYTIKLRMENQAKQYLYFTILKVFTVTFFGITTVLFIDTNPSTILWSIFFANLIFGIIAYYLLEKEIGISWTLAYTKPLLLFVIPIMLVVLINSLMSSASKFFIVKYLSMKSLAIYTIALKIGMLYLLFTQAFKMVWDPIAIKNFTHTGNIKIYIKAFNYYLLTGALLAVLLYLNKTTIIYLIATKTYTSAAILTTLILSAFFWKGATIVIASANAWTKKTYFDLISAIVGSIIGISIIFFTIENYKLQAVAFGEFAAAFSSFILTYIFAQRNIYIQYNYFIITIFILITFICIVYF